MSHMRCSCFPVCLAVWQPLGRKEVPGILNHMHLGIYLLYLAMDSAMGPIQLPRNLEYFNGPKLNSFAQLL